MGQNSLTRMNLRLRCKLGGLRVFQETGRHLQLIARPLAIVERHGRELHGCGRAIEVTRPVSEARNFRAFW